jgi:hypothetical protein
VDSRDASLLEPSGGAEGRSTADTNPSDGTGGNTAGSTGAGEGSGGSLPFVPGEQGSGGSAGSGQEPVGGSSGSGSGSGGVTAEVEPEVIGGCFNQLLGNGAFDAGHAAWQEVAPVRDVIVGRDYPALVATGVTPQSGDYLAWIGGVQNGQFEMYETTLSQDVAIPTETLSLTLSGYVWVAQSDLGEMPSDWAVLEFSDPQAPLDDPYNGLRWQVLLWNDGSVTTGWTHFEVQRTDVEFLRGRTLSLIGSARPAANGTLNVWLDSLRLEARCER